MKALQPLKASCQYLYKYSKCDRLEWLKTIIHEHQLYLPTLDQLNDPQDGRPSLAPLSEEQWVTFISQHNPCRLSEAEIRTFIGLRTRENLLQWMTERLHAGFNAFGVYSMTKRHDNPFHWK